MEDPILLVSKDIKALKTAMDNNDRTGIDRSVLSLERQLLDNHNFKNIGDERTISTALILLTQAYDDEIKDRLTPLSEWLEVIRDINNKFYAILNHEIGLEDLLISYLVTWKLIPIELNISIDADMKQELKAARERTNNEQKLRTFISVFFEYVKLQNGNDKLNELVRVCELVIDNFKELMEWNPQGLFCINHTGIVYGVKIKATAEGNGEIESLNETGIEMKKAANEAFRYIKDKFPYAKNWDITWEIPRGNISFEGNSIGLALSMGILSTIEGFEIDPFTAFTGHVEWDSGKIKRIGDLDVKLSTAKDQGIRRVFIPIDNISDVTNDCGLDIVPVGSVDEAKNKLTIQTYMSSNIPLERQAEIKLRQLEIELSPLGIKAKGPIQDGDSYKRIQFTDYRDTLFVNIYYGRNGITVNIQPKDCPLKVKLQSLCDQVFGIGIEEKKEEIKRDKYIINDKETQQRVEAYLFGLPNALREIEQNCVYRAKIIGIGQIVHVRQFNKGTLTIDGQDSLFSSICSGIQSVLGISPSPIQENSKNSKLVGQINAVKSIELGDQWIGTDEAGKGDYFGPLVGAAVMVDKNIADQLLIIGVKDSKNLTDNKNRELAIRINEICGKHAQVVLIPPVRYNLLYEQFKSEGKNLNTLLAWVHTRALEDLLTTYPQNQITVIIDKFADEQYINSKLLGNSRRTKLNLIQLPKAEANIAVAAASVLARAQFLNWLERTSHQFKFSLPKGASDPKVVQIARHIVETLGREKLTEYVKLHFRTTKEVLL
jgi:ribonuclease HIII